MSTTDPSANTGDQNLNRLENFAQPRGFWSRNDERYRAIDVRTSQNRSGTKMQISLISGASLQQEPCMYSSEGKIKVFHE